MVGKIALKKWRDKRRKYQKFRDNNICEMSRSEFGNIEYEFFMPHDKENEVCIFEKWENEEMNAAETAYYIDVQARVSKKLLEAAQ